MKLHILFLSAALSLMVNVSRGAVNLGIDGEDATSVGIYIKELSTGRVIAEKNPSIALTPASVMKAVTTATTLSLCGPDTVFSTPVGLTGNIAGGVCSGNLLVRSSSDPTVESDYFKSNKGLCDSIVVMLKRMGINRIDGKVIVSQRLKDAGPNMQWECEDIAWPYGAGLFGFNYRDNIVMVAPATGEVTPKAPGLEVCVEKSSENDIVRGVNSNRLMVYTKDPDDRKWKINVTVPDPSAVFVEQMTQTLRDAGIEIVGQDVSSDNGFHLIYTHRSPCFGDIMRSLMVRSDNMFAEGMLRAIAPDSSRKAAISREKSLWNKRGLRTENTTINDGSGLARSNRLSPIFLGEVLEWMAKSPLSAEYVSYFPRAGKDGTMRGFLAKSPLKGRIALKTGSVGGVQCYAGYKIDTKGTPTHVIVIMVNGFFCPRSDVRKASEQLLTDLFN